MSQPFVAYEDVRSAMERGLQADRGVRITLTDRGSAINFRQRCYRFRNAVRKQSLELYAEGDPRRNTTPYDGLVVTYVENIVYIKKRTGELDIEEIEE